MFLVAILRHNITKLLRTDKKADLKSIREGQLLLRARRLKFSANKIPFSSFISKKTFFNDKETGIFRERPELANPDPLAAAKPCANPMMDPNNMVDMMKKNIEELNKKRERKEKINEEAFIDKMKPLIEQASHVLNETLGGLKGADPNGKIQRRAQHKKDNDEASPEENHLAESVTKLTQGVAKTIEKAKESIKDLPKAKKDLGPLLNILNGNIVRFIVTREPDKYWPDPLFQILSAVGLLLKGVLGLVANLLGALHLDGLVKGLLGGLGLDKLLDSLGLGGIFDKK